MTAAAEGATLTVLDDATRLLVRTAAVVAAADEEAIRRALAVAAESVPHLWIEELLLQTYLFAGFPRALNALREWRRRVPEPPATSADDPATWEARGRETCRRVYGAMYDRLRVNIDALHPAIDRWMIVEGYGKVLSRPGLDLARRELCIVAACVASGQDRQLHSHLHGSLNVGVAASVVREALSALEGAVDPARLANAQLLLERVVTT